MLIFTNAILSIFKGLLIEMLAVLAEGIFFPLLAFPPGNETKLSSTICGIELGKTLLGYDCSEFMLCSTFWNNLFWRKQMLG